MTTAAVLLLLACSLLPAAPSRIKELASVEGVRDNQLIGYGVVVGLAGTGDKRQTVFSAQTLANLLDRMGVQVTPQAILVRNMAAVLVTATLPAFAQPGTPIDVTAAAIGDSSNLQGGLLVLTPLRGADGQVYAVAQGPVVTGGFVAGRGGQGTAMTVNHPTVGRIPSGAIVERMPPTVAPTNSLRLQLRRSDFTTAARIVEAVNRKFPGEPLAHAEHAGLVVVKVPPPFAGKVVEFVSGVETLAVEADRPVKVVVNERTGTIVMGKDVRIAPVAVMHGNLSVEITTTYEVSQPEPLSQGKTMVTPQVGVGVKEEKARNVTLKEGATVEDLVKAMLAIGSTPRDIIAILQSLRSARALEAELEVI